MLEFHQLKKIYLQAEEVHKTALTLSMYCRAYGDLEGIYNLTTIIELLAKNSDDLYYGLCELVDKEQDTEPDDLD